MSLNEKEKNKLEVIKKVIAKEITQQKAALMLGVSDRTIRRLLTRFKNEGEEGLVHRGRNIIKDKKITEELKQEIINSYLNTFYDFNFTHFYEESGYAEIVSKSSIYEILTKNEIISPEAQHKTVKLYNEKMKKAIEAREATTEQIVLFEQRNEEEKQKHIRRSNIHINFGEDTQLDATPYLWFANKETYLHLLVDKATKITLYGWFDYQETTRAYFKVLMNAIILYGIPKLIKTDKRSCFSINNIQGEVQDKKTQFSRICNELGIELECSSDPVFKPNVERENKTFKGRLKQELRINNIATIEKANKYLTEVFIPKINAKFAYEINPNKNNMKENTYTKEQLNLIISERDNRKLDNASSIKYLSSYYVPVNYLTGEVCTKPYRTDCTLVIAYDYSLWCYIDNELYFLSKVEQQKPKEQEKKEDRRKYNGGHKPKPNHPWKR